MPPIAVALMGGFALADDLRSAVGKRLPPDMRRSDVGFRPARTPDPK